MQSMQCNQSVLLDRREPQIGIRIQVQEGPLLQGPSVSLKTLDRGGEIPGEKIQSSDTNVLAGSQ